MIATIRKLDELTSAAGEPSHYNFAVTDGNSLLATRYVSDTRHEPENWLAVPANHLVSVSAEFDIRIRAI